MSLLELRKEKKKKKPKFRRQDFQISSLSESWRQPKGQHSKLRRKFKGHVKHPSMGFSAPKAVRFLHPSGLKERIVANLKDLENMTKEEGITIGSRVGLKKKLELLKKIKELNHPLLNIKDVDEFIKQFEESKKTKQAKQKEKQVKKDKREKEAEKKGKEKKEDKKELTPKEKIATEKEEKRKTLEAGE